MKIIIGLGNPGKKYEKTRHNIGFMVLDELRKAWGFPGFLLNKKFDAEVSEGTVLGKKVLLVKPQTFMNLSGASVRKVLDFYKLSPAHVFVVQDELDLPLGKHKIATDSSAAGHNGIKNIIEHLRTQAFSRLRIGIATKQQDASCLRSAHDFVLDAFTDEERETLQGSLSRYQEEVEKFITAESL
ncbi:MAG: aminoacyl-tRNA hydrolase [Candidatus Moranbacteria bacterium]|nr:aminoacyl-tRNA hydrolase [Candidatus Moranbacteria bacterium]